MDSETKTLSEINDDFTIDDSDNFGINGISNSLSSNSLSSSGDKVIKEEDDGNIWNMLINQLVECEFASEKVIPTYHPYNSNVIPTKEEIEEFDEDNRKWRVDLPTL
ncbi:10353_t:CDS:2 [Rhizophagus irregularis]|nr:10353_t:CDS:2 [Rhizophagus irregularis]